MSEKLKTKILNDYGNPRIDPVMLDDYFTWYEFTSKKDNKKFLLKSYKLTDDKSKEKKVIPSFIGKMKEVSEFDHPNIVKVTKYDAWKDKDSTYTYGEMITEHQFKSLQEMIDSNPSEKTIYKWAVQSAKALEYLEKKETYHGGINPLNMTISENSDLKLTNFRIQEIYNDIGPFKGKSAIPNIDNEIYRAPEYGKEKLNIRMDAYSWGMTFYALITKSPIKKLKEEYVQKSQSEEDNRNFNQKAKAEMEGKTDDFLVSVVYLCLNYNPYHRPTFAQIGESLKADQENTERKLIAEVDKATNGKSVFWLANKPSLIERTEYIGFKIKLEKDRLRALFLHENNIGDTGFGKMIKYLKEAKSIVTKLWVNENNLTNHAAAALKEALVNMNEISELNLSDNKIRDEGIKDIARALAGKKCLEKLWINGNLFEDEGAAELGKMLESHDMLLELGLSENNIGNYGIEQIAKVIEYSPKVTKLWLDSNKFGSKGAIQLAKAISVMSDLSELSLSSNLIKDEGVTEIASALKDKSKLITLWLHGTGISDKGAIVLADSLENHHNLERLVLQANEIGDEGASKIAAVLKGKKKLKMLWLSFNKIGDSGAKAVSESLTENSALEDLRLYENKISSELIIELKKKFDNVKELMI